ncbi:MAG: DUF3883 domain-containing protein [Candidatus Pacebacteria bacterium]|nr:DUF3883 domain-containing protein [Candidatus Paceibacterota bacterium]
MYEVPEEYFYRIHHIRPRFKNDVENVLFYMATEIAKLDPEKQEAFKEKLNNTIKFYPGNTSKEEKTINNWRTEISALFGLIEYEGEVSKPGRMSLLLSETQDLIEFFRYFLFYFQYPGGHLKPAETLEFIKAGIRLKPAKYLMQVMLEGKKLVGDEGKFGITKAEATHLIFNDLRVTRDHRPAKETAEIILENRKNDVQYDNSGDVIRYAGDVLDYMELADLVKLRPNYQYYLNTINLETIQAFINDGNYFEPYEALYGKADVSIADVVATQQAWFHYVNNKLDSSIFKANILSIIEEAGATTEDAEKSAIIKEVLARIQATREGQAIKTKEIGDIGETMVIEHEKARLTILTREDLLHLIKKIPETFAVGYDISSYEGEGDIRRYIEVKTSISRGRLAAQNFHMTPSEWSAANSLRKTYFVYRLMISTNDVSLFLIQDPVGQYKSDLLDMIPRDGADIRYNEKSGVWEKLLV